MVTQENGNGKKSPKMKYVVASVVVAVVVIIASVGYVVFVKEDEMEGTLVSAPRLYFYLVKNESNYHVILDEINENNVNKNYVHYFLELQYIYYTLSQTGNITLNGRFLEMQQTQMDNSTVYTDKSGLLSYVDSNSDGHFSIEEYFIFDSNIVGKEGGIVLVYRGYLDGSSSYEYYAEIGRVSFYDYFL